MTALWWTIQEDIKAGKASAEDMAGSVIESFKKHLKTDYSGASIARQANHEEIGHCPIYG